MAAFTALGQVIRYRIRPGSDGVPNLERWSSGNTANFSAGTRVFQVVARGIDDLQVQYTNARGAVSDNAPQVRTDDYTGAHSPITRVTVTLSARSEAKNVAGARSVASGPTALRGQLTSSVTPRAALGALTAPAAPRASPSAAGGSPGPPPWY